MRKLSKNYIIVKREKPEVTIYIRKYPKDYKEYHEREDFGSVHPNKLRTWLEFAKAAKAARGKKFEDVIYSVMKRMRGKKYTTYKPKYILMDDDEIRKLKVEAFMKGINPRWVDILTRPKKVREGKKEEIFQILR